MQIVKELQEMIDEVEDSCYRWGFNVASTPRRYGIGFEIQFKERFLVGLRIGCLYVTYGWQFDHLKAMEFATTASVPEEPKPLKPKTRPPLFTTNGRGFGDLH